VTISPFPINTPFFRKEPQIAKVNLDGKGPCKTDVRIRYGRKKRAPEFSCGRNQKYLLLLRTLASAYKWSDRVVSGSQ